MRYRWLVFGMMLSAGGSLAEEPSSWPGFRGRGDSRAVGVATCVDVATGEPLWSERLPGECWASPIGFGEYVAFFCKGGDVAMYRRGRMADRVAESSLSATDIVYGVAAVEDAWLVRTGRGLIKVTGQPASANASRPAESTREGQR